MTTHGHGHPRIVAAIREQAGKLDQVIFAGLTHEPAEDVARGLVRLAPAGPRARVLLRQRLDRGRGGAEDGARLLAQSRRAARTRILALEHAYHGDTVGAMSAGARGVFNAPYEPLLFEVGRIPFPARGREQATLDALEAACRAGDVAALIVEPLILGAAAC